MKRTVKRNTVSIAPQGHATPTERRAVEAGKISVRARHLDDMREALPAWATCPDCKRRAMPFGKRRCAICARNRERTSA